MTDLSDLSLVTQVAVLHNRRAFDQLVRKHQSPVRRFLLHLTAGNETLSDDLAQDTFLKAYTGITQFRGQASFQTWLMRIAYNVFYDYRRRAAQGDRLTEPDSGQKPAGQSLPMTQGTSPREVSIDICRALALLKDEERSCITLQLIDGYPIDEIAVITGMPSNTVKSHLRRGKERLANFLRKNGYG